MPVALSILDIAPIPQGETVRDALDHSVELAQQAEALGYLRYWVAEHHNMSAAGSAATPVLVGHLASKTKSIRVGAGGVMLPNHSPLVIAEMFGTLETLYPGRIDLALGRAPGDRWPHLAAAAPAEQWRRIVPRGCPAPAGRCSAPGSPARR